MIRQLADNWLIGSRWKCPSENKGVYLLNLLCIFKNVLKSFSEVSTWSRTNANISGPGLFIHHHSITDSKLRHLQIISQVWRNQNMWIYISVSNINCRCHDDYKFKCEFPNLLSKCCHLQNFTSWTSQTDIFTNNQDRLQESNVYQIILYQLATENFVV